MESGNQTVMIPEVTQNSLNRLNQKPELKEDIERQLRIALDTLEAHTDGEEQLDMLSDPFQTIFRDIHDFIDGLAGTIYRRPATDFVKAFLMSDPKYKDLLEKYPAILMKIRELEADRKMAVNDPTF